MRNEDRVDAEITAIMSRLAQLEAIAAANTMRVDRLREMVGGRLEVSGDAWEGTVVTVSDGEQLDMFPTTDAKKWDRQLLLGRPNQFGTPDAKEWDRDKRLRDQFA